jgi:hypothetical protein
VPPEQRADPFDAQGPIARRLGSYRCGGWRTDSGAPTAPATNPRSTSRRCTIAMSPASVRQIADYLKDERTVWGSPFHCP